MQRGSDKHGPRVDEALSSETEGLVRSGHATHAEDWKSPDPSGEDQAAPEVVHGGLPDGMTDADVEGRSRLATYLGKEVWPATGAQLVAVAANRDAPEDVLAQLSYLPAGRSFENLQEAWKALAGGTEQHRS